MLGAIIGDIVGSRFEWHNHRSKDFELFTNFEDAIRNAISIGGDSDTLAAITGGMAQAYYGIPEDIRKSDLGFLDETQRGILDKLESIYMK